MYRAQIVKLTALIDTTYRSLNVTVTQSKNCPFGVKTIIELKNITHPTKAARRWLCFD